MLCDFENQLLSIEGRRQRVQDRRKFAIEFDVYNGTLQTAVEEYHDWFSTPHCTDIGLPTPFEAGIAEGLDWFRRLERDQQ